MHGIDATYLASQRHATWNRSRVEFLRFITARDRGVTDASTIIAIICGRAADGLPII